MHFLPRILITAALGLALAGELLAQTTRSGTTSRPGGATRGTNRGAATTRTSISSSSSSSSGPRQYRSNTLLGDAIIQVDPESRSLVIITDEETHLEVDKIIKNLDQPRPQVLIKVVFIEVTWNKGLDLGVEGNYTFNIGDSTPAVNAGTQTVTTVNGTTPANNAGGTTNTTTSVLQSTIPAAAAISETVGASSLFGLSALTQGSFVRVLSDDWSVTLRALATKGKVEVLSRPSILARNNQEAVIVVGQEVPFITNSRVTDDGQTINTIQYDNVGIILKVTPFITSDGSVEMIIAPEISSLTDQTVPISNNASAPVIAKRSAETVVVTPNRATVVIGGLMETQRIDSVQKIPLLGDIPLLGAVFRRTIKNDVKRELMIFLTPEIVTSARGLQRASAGETDRTTLIKESFKEGELNQYLDNPLYTPSPTDDSKPVVIPAGRVERRTEETVTIRRAEAVKKP